MRHALLTALFAGCGVAPAEGFDAELSPVVRAPEPVQPMQPVEPLPVEPAPTGLPCDVHAALQAACAGCHVGATRIPPFSTRDDLVSLGAKVGQRLSSTTAPMPPPGAFRPLTSGERALIDAWVSSGMPAGRCGALR
ncbi:MAG: hypothetical protein JNK82_26570 [Myxococcaceae bacterium]|nr:hypothetical protein [Myxococcaceae bacterium]